MVNQYDKAFYEHITTGSKRSAQIVLPIVFEWIGKPDSLVDVGCGTGTWLAAAGELGVEETLGLDGAYVDRSQLQISVNNFVAADLQAPPEVGRKFDLAMSLEVAEHLPPNSAYDFVLFLTSLSDRILFSAAVPGQGGVGHVNEQWPSYWADLFNSLGFAALDPVRPRIWQNIEVERFYSQNTFVYVKRDLLAEDGKLRAEHDRFKKQRLMLVYDSIIYRQPTITQALRGLVGATKRSLQHRLGLSKSGGRRVS